ncbi:MAG TPA: hypothetical protein DCZ75_12180 [Geobacter sp.]|nr:hypothetical protein [Geobacter sp.]
MGNKLKCVALSALVLPGLGQLYRGSRVKGGILILLDNVFILGALFVALRSAGKLMLAAQQGTLKPEQVLTAIKTDNPWASWLLGGFMVLWVYSVIEAVMHKDNHIN